MISIPIRSHYAPFLLGSVVFTLAIAACWVNSLGLLVKIVSMLCTCGLAIRCCLERRKSAKMTQLNLMANSCTIRVKENWLAASLAVHFCGGPLLVLKLRCLEPASSQFGEVFWLWLYPAVVTELEQRQLRHFLANQFKPQPS